MERNRLPSPHQERQKPTAVETALVEKLDEMRETFQRRMWELAQALMHRDASIESLVDAIDHMDTLGAQGKPAYTYAQNSLVFELRENPAIARFLEQLFTEKKRLQRQLKAYRIGKDSYLDN